FFFQCCEVVFEEQGINDRLATSTPIDFQQKTFYLF
ncbi:MAG: hypothetical protein ACI9XO_003266, partial [Paraglaciecola sp.]